ncbi:GNAT family N-acetyltransferase [Phenylobacterium soli]|uniref:GNAT family N-acetyltransferase n=1 Tax=Phenylobacterium soli TaxID=2170551 RepID=A0A328AM67_9CAUL|nr:GNAT family N-acetyltransferase [Phenylobacterium soli]RAK55521.1 GNAT family N-acetyltransferase [Phenylobacterium soli]
MLSAAEIESLERSVVAAVAPERVVEMAGWLVPLDAGPIGRAKSAAPLVHDADPEAVADVEQIYGAIRLPPAFRLAETPGLAPVRDELIRRGYRAETPTIMKTGSAAGLTTLSDRPAELLAAPDEAWAACFTGEGFDPEEGAARVRNLARSPDALFGAVREGDRTVACGVVTFNHGWIGVHGMRTAPDARRQGLAGRILAAFGREAQGRGIDRVVLQVTEENPARSLYRSAGLNPVWRYHYWTRS